MNIRLPSLPALLILCCLLPAASCAEHSSDHAESRPEATPVPTQRDPLQDLRDSKRSIHGWAKKGVDIEEARLALDGDPEAARFIAQEFAHQYDWPRAEYWFEIAVQNGSYYAINGLASAMRDDNCRRAVFWDRRYLEDQRAPRSGTAFEGNRYALEEYTKECNAGSVESGSESVSTRHDSLLELYGSKRSMHALAKEGVGADEARLALEGDPEAARLIAQEFAHRHDRPRAEYWFGIAVENGDYDAINDLAIAMRHTNCRRAVFWTRRYLEDPRAPRSGTVFEGMRYALGEYIKECKDLRSP